MCLRCEDRPLTKQEKVQAELYKAINWSLLYGAQGMGKNYAAASKVRERMWALRNGEVNHSLPELPQKICNYRQRKLYWYGELHGSNNFIHNPSMQASHRVVTRGMATHHTLERFFAEYADESLEIANSYEMGSTTGRDDAADPLRYPWKGKRFIGISEPVESEGFDQEFLKKFTGDEWVETRTLDVSSKSWVPQGKVFVSSGRPLKINEKRQEQID